MKTEKTLKASSYFLRFLMIMQIIFCLSLAFTYFHSMISPEKYVNLTINESLDLVYNFDVKKVPATYDEWKTTKQLTHYNLLIGTSKFSVIWLRIFKIIGFFFILYYLDKFIKNTQNLRLFFESNIKILNKIIYLIIALLLVNLLFGGIAMNPISMVFNDTEIPHFITIRKKSLDFIIYYPLAIIFFFILKEVFKKGQELKQENDLTI
mgnify:FL=1